MRPTQKGRFLALYRVTMSCRKALTEFSLVTSNLLSRSRVSGRPLYGRTFWYYYAQERTIPILLLTIFWISNGAILANTFVRKTSLFPDEMAFSRLLSGKSAFSRTNLQHSHIGPQSKLQRQIAAGGIGSRKGKGPTKWEGPPAAICHCKTPHSIRPTVTSRKQAVPRTNLQHSHFGPQSKLQRQIAEGGIGSRTGRGPTKWGGPPAAICRCNINHRSVLY